MSVDYLDRDAFIAKYTPNDQSAAAVVRAHLQRQEEKYAPDGWVMLECQMLSTARGSRMGEQTIIPFGPNNTWKEIPKGPVSPRGLASDMAVVVAVCLRGGGNTNVTGSSVSV